LEKYNFLPISANETIQSLLQQIVGTFAMASKSYI